MVLDNYCTSEDTGPDMIEITGSKFSNNKAKNGGVLSTANNNSAGVNSSEFVNSSAANNGGIIQM